MALKFRSYTMGQDVLTFEFEKIGAPILRQLMRGLKESFGSELDLLALNGTLTLFDKGVARHQEALTQYLSDFMPATCDAPTCWKLPVHYNGADLESLSLQLKCSIGQIIVLHQSQKYIIEGFGFLPGFFYASTLPQALQIARKPTPALRVPRRAVAIAGRQTGVYPIETSGGWHVLGELAFDLFDHRSRPPMLMQIGDEICFHSVTAEELETYSKAWIKETDRKHLISC